MGILASKSSILATCVLIFAIGCSRQPDPPRTDGVKPNAPKADAPPARVATSASEGGAPEPVPAQPSEQDPAPDPEAIARGTVLAAKIFANIQADPKISIKNLEVRYVPSESRNRSEAIAISGTVASEDAHIAVRNHVYKLTDMGLIGSLTVIGPSAPDPPPPAWTGPPAGDPLVPLCAGLTVVTAIASQGDYESIKTIESITDDTLRLKYSNQPNPPWWTGWHSKTPATVTLFRTVIRSDLEAARRYHQIFVTTNRVTESAPGSTAIGTSAAVLRELKTAGRAELALCSSADDTEVRDDKGNVRRPPAGCLQYTDPITLTRVGPSPVKVRALLNGVPTDLPAVHATARAERAEFFFLDDERNPLTLAFRLGIGTVPALTPLTRELCEQARRGEGSVVMTGDPPRSCDLPDGGDRDTLRVVSISTRCSVERRASDGPGAGGATGGGGALPTGNATGVGTSADVGTGAGAGGGAGATAGGSGAAGGARAMEAALAEHGTLDVYSIFFGFNSDVLREESEPTLNDIAAVLARNPGWKLRVNGHTDGIGTEAFNLDLSRRRAAAVKAALVQRHGIDGRRLETSGAGESQPKDSNDTLEGRARNRRVELVKGS